jgi:hypothetical protein
MSVDRDKQAAITVHRVLDPVRELPILRQLACTYTPQD